MHDTVHEEGERVSSPGNGRDSVGRSTPAFVQISATAGDVPCGEDVSNSP